MVVWRALSVLLLSIALLNMPILGLIADASAHSAFQLSKVTTEQDLDFGKVATIGLVGRVRVTPDGERELTGVENIGGSYGAAIVTLSGAPNRRFAIINPRVAFLRSRSGDRLFVKKVISNVKPVGQFDHNGKATIRFGGDLLVPPNVRQGFYRGRVTFWVVQFKPRIGTK